MEELLIVILQIVFELVLQIILYAGLDLTAWWFTREDKSDSAGCGRMFIFFSIGAGLGALMNWVHPRPVLDYDWMRIGNLIVGPFLAGGLAWLFADWRRRCGAKMVPRLHFFFALTFVLGFDLLRFIYSNRDAIF